MIDYVDGYFGLPALLRVYGSASYKAAVFATISSGIYLLMYYYGGTSTGTGSYGLRDYNLLDHPYPITVIVTAFMFVLSAKVTFSYNRFWEACIALHSMHSKWLDVCSTMAAFHLQSEAYEGIQPPSFGDHVHLNEDAMRGGGLQMDRRETETATEDGGDRNDVKSRTPFWKRNRRKVGRRRSRTDDDVVSINALFPPRSLPFPRYNKHYRATKWTSQTDDDTNGYSRRRMSVCEAKNGNPSLFLREGAHLVSLLSAVALSTLRCDSEDAEAPLVTFEPGRPWPPYNSDDDPDMKKYGLRRRQRFLKTLKYIFDVSRTEKERRAYNSARPFPVIGGVSPREAAMLQSARGAPAKVALMFLWLNEFIIREHLHGSLGAVAPPIVSRLQQYSSDGHIWYNSARKMSYIPFPFPHAQMATLFEIVSMFLIPGLMLSKTAQWFGLFLNFLTVLLFAGLNELSKELEYPFRSIPNDLPLNLFQARFNEAIITMFSGFHPDAWWEVSGDL